METLKRSSDRTIRPDGPPYRPQPRADAPSHAPPFKISLLISTLQEMSRLSLTGSLKATSYFLNSWEFRISNRKHGDQRWA